MNRSKKKQGAAVSLLCLLLVLSLCACTAGLVIKNPADLPSSDLHETKDRIILNVEEKTLSVGQRFALVAAITPLPEYTPAFTFASSDEGVATVSKDGVVTAEGAGSCVITVSTGEGKQVLCH